MTTSTTKALRLGITDAGALLLIYLLPTLSHITSVPFYLLDPMRIAVLGALLCTRDWKNSLVLAVTLPLFSALIGMHPIFPKCALIAVELSVNVLLFAWFMHLVDKRIASGAVRNSTAAQALSIGSAAFASILLSKLLYYGLKAAVLSAGLMQMSLVSTALWIQLLVAVALSIGFALVFSKNR